MSDTNADQQEPSMEEILASIRRIISEDEGQESGGETVAAEADDEESSVETVNDDNTEPEAEDIDGDILELTDVVEDEEPLPEPEPDAAGESEPVDEIELVDDDEAKLVSDKVEEVSAATMSDLTAVLAANAAIGDGNQTLEQLVKDVLRPILKEWLDENLPDIVDRIVREEVERIAARAK